MRHYRLYASLGKLMELMIFGAALAVTAALTFVAIQVLRRLGILDHPNERSSHVLTTIRGAGIGPAIVFTAFSALDSPHWNGRNAAILAGLACMALGAIEDTRGVPICIRAVVQVIAAAAASILVVGGTHVEPVVQMEVLFIAVGFVAGYINAFNFMDGINGLSSAHVAITGAAWFMAGRIDHMPGLERSGLLLAATGLGFAGFNFPHAYCFLGDAGSYFYGAVLPVVAMSALRDGLPPEAALAPLALYIADTGSTLVRRLSRGDAWYRPHREHVYQRLVLQGWSHARTTLTAAMIMAAASLLGTVSLYNVPKLRVASDVCILVLTMAYLASPRLVRSVASNDPYPRIRPQTSRPDPES